MPPQSEDESVSIFMIVALPLHLASYYLLLHVCSSNYLKVSIYPNPVSARLNLQLQTMTTGRYTVKLYDAAGKEYLRREYTLAPGNSTISIQVNDLTPGMYTLVLATTGGDLKHLKFLKN